MNRIIPVLHQTPAFWSLPSERRGAIVRATRSNAELRLLERKSFWLGFYAAARARREEMVRRGMAPIPQDERSGHR